MRGRGVISLGEIDWIWESFEEDEAKFPALMALASFFEFFRLESRRNA